MTVRQLIDLLEDCDPEAIVLDSKGSEIDDVDSESEEDVVYLES